MEVGASSLRGIGRSIAPMIISIAGVCGVRILWIFTVFAAQANLLMLYISYPVSWIFTVSAQLIAFAVCKRKVNREFSDPPEQGKTDLSEADGGGNAQAAA